MDVFIILQTMAVAAGADAHSSNIENEDLNEVR